MLHICDAQRQHCMNVVWQSICSVTAPDVDQGVYVMCRLVTNHAQKLCRGHKNYCGRAELAQSPDGQTDRQAGAGADLR